MDRRKLGTLWALGALALPGVLAAALPIHTHAGEPSAAQIQKQVDQSQAQLVQAVQQLNQANPFAQTPGTTSPASATQQLPAGYPQLPAGIQKKLQWVQGFLRSAWVQKYLKLLSDPGVQKSLVALIHNPRRLDWIFAEAAWLIFIMALKAWRMTKIRSFFGVLFLQLWVLCLFLGGLLYAIPMLIFGSEYSALVNAVLAVLRK